MTTATPSQTRLDYRRVLDARIAGSPEFSAAGLTEGERTQLAAELADRMLAWDDGDLPAEAVEQMAQSKAHDVIGEWVNP